eukprot:CAMPEP_0115744742 /NCGR_PEP_ID=MMETSP0272-20121206/91764_1 /TAXON_ID=71861 /ORGANISM="Scrippsiella trochoidea, Strain CCMP3099" /LENGTH=321 /DNA_ID=CAMNT_0003189633 /DNA_START=28 /DNA_END=989 /DNA_ORIENTATION=-
MSVAYPCQWRAFQGVRQRSQHAQALAKAFPCQWRAFQGTLQSSQEALTPALRHEFQAAQQWSQLAPNLEVAVGSATIPSSRESTSGIQVPVAHVSEGSATIPASRESTGGIQVPVACAAAGSATGPMGRDSNCGIQVPIARMSGGSAMAPVCQEAGIPVPVACVSTCPAVIQAAPLAENKFAPVVFNHNSLAGPSAAQGCGSCVPLRIEGVRSSQGPTNSYVPPPVAPSSSSYVPPIQAPASGSFVPLPVAQPPVIAASAALGQQPGGLPQAAWQSISVLSSLSGGCAVLAGALPQAMPAQVVQASSGLQQAVPQVAGGFA